MLITKLVAAAVVAGSVFVPQAGAVPPPNPGECKATLEGVLTPADPAGLIQAGAVAVATGQVVCVRDVLNSTPAETLSQWSGDTSIAIATASNSVVCGNGPRIWSSAGPVLVMEIEVACVIPVSDPRRNEPLHAVLHWATHNPAYNCCDSIQADLIPVALAAQI